MKIEAVLVELEGLLHSWGVSTSEWILVANYAYKLLGYDVKLRLGHLNILVVRSSIPWKIKEGVEVHPPRNTKYREDFRRFIEKTGFDFDLNLATDSEFKDKEGYYVWYTLPSDKQIKIQKPTGAIKEFEKLLALSTQEGFGVERLEKDISYLKDLIKVLSKKKEENTKRKLQRLLERYKKEAERRLVKKPKYDKKLIFGIVASPGMVRGKVKIVNKTKDAEVLKAGDILVTKMTSPTLLVILPKVAAIIADRGGKLSHAAILAREIGVPCIVGTQVATKVLKNGDIVEVDAEVGVVRKLFR